MCRSHQQEARPHKGRKDIAEHKMARAGWPRYRHRHVQGAANERIALHKRRQRESRPDRILSMFVERRRHRHDCQSNRQVVDCR